MNEENVDIGGTIEVNGVVKNSNEVVPVFHDTDVDAIAQEHVLYTENSINYKHHNWDGKDDEFFLHKSFNTSSSVWAYDLKFRDPVNIKFDSNGGDVNTIQINDP